LMARTLRAEPSGLRISIRHMYPFSVLGVENAKYSKMECWNSIVSGKDNQDSRD
jgi:hypothetical protein